MGAILMQILTSGMAEDNGLRLHLLDSVAHMRLLTMGLILILVLRFAPIGGAVSKKEASNGPSQYRDHRTR
jgi:branched-chain amino acid transport system permease protein